MRNLKIIMIGPSGVGKTTLRKIFFEQENPMKLLNETLEPTRGIETQIYDVEGSVAIHDLAGQQLEDWFTQSYQVLSDSDLIIVMLNATDGWEENKALWERVNFQRQRVCPNALLMILYHKVDLLGEQQRQNLEWDIQSTFSGNREFNVFTSSIVPEFFIQTFKKFVGGLHQLFLSIREIGAQEIFQRVEILSQFIDRNTLVLPEVINSTGLPVKIARALLEDMYKQNYIKIDESTNAITLGEQGIFLINGLNDIGIHASNTTFEDIPLVKGIIFADFRGICFFIYEYKQGFFERLLPRGDEFPDPSLVSGFMSAIGGFANEIGQDLKTINLTGMEAQIISQTVEEINCIFFLENIPNNRPLLEVLMKFVQDFNMKYREDVKIVSKSGNVGFFASKCNEIEKMIQDLNGDLHNLILKHSPITANQLISIYQKVDQARLDPEVVKDLKQLIFHFTITQREDDLVRIDELLERYHIG